MVLRGDKRLTHADHEPAKNVVVDRGEPVGPQQSLEARRPNAARFRFYLWRWFCFRGKVFALGHFRRITHQALFLLEVRVAKHQDNRFYRIRRHQFQFSCYSLPGR